MHNLRSFFIAALAVVPGIASAFESDVHFGLTKWLALQAGYTPGQAETIATGDQRVDSGDMQFIELMPGYACTAHDAESATLVAQHHDPTAGKVPAPPDARTVVAGSDAARTLAVEIAKASPAQTSFLLFKLGTAVHALQDSWSHQGVPDVPQIPLDVATCDPNFAWGHPKTRGGWNSHRADLTSQWPADTMAMAAASYEVLQQYPPIDRGQRKAKPWNDLRALVETFARASTKTDKRKWFEAQGITDVSFLEGVSLPDGAQPFTQQWGGRKLPPLPTLQSTQHHIDADLLAFMSDFFREWASTGDLNALAAKVAPGPAGAATKDASARKGVGATTAASELAARLKLWRIRDHGRVAALVHATQPLTARERASVDAIAKDPRALASYEAPTQAYFPLVVKGPEPSPLLGFIITPGAANTPSAGRALAIAKFRHAPYDTVEVVAQKVDNRWSILSIGAVVDH